MCNIKYFYDTKYKGHNITNRCRPAIFSITSSQFRNTTKHNQTSTARLLSCGILTGLSIYSNSSVHALLYLASLYTKIPHGNFPVSLEHNFRQLTIWCWWQHLGDISFPPSVCLSVCVSVYQLPLYMSGVIYTTGFFHPLKTWRQFNSSLMRFWGIPPRAISLWVP